MSIFTENNPTVSIITVCFNESPGRIERTFKSISEQSYRNIQWIVVDGGSRQETVSYIEQYTSKISIFISEKDNGIYDAMNKGVANATGDWINFMNVGDSFASNDTVTRVVDFIFRNPGYDGYYGDIIDVDNDGNDIRTTKMPSAYNKRDLHDLIVHHQSLFSRRSLFDTAGDFDTSYKIAGDKDWMVRTTIIGAKGLHTGLVICRFNNNPRSGLAETLEECAIIQDRYYTTLEHLCFKMRWAFIKTIMRLRDHNFTVPVYWYGYFRRK